MPLRRAAIGLLLFCLMPLGFSSCAVRRRIITRMGGNTARPLLSADKAHMVVAIARQYDAIRDFSATVNMAPALGSAEKNKVTEYKDVRAYILFRRPADIHILGLYPVVLGTAFDMVSNGTDFKLYLPSRNRFLVGLNTVEQPSPNKLENLRPQHFLEALLVKPLDTAANKVLLENFTDEDNAFYILHEVHEDGGGQLILRRTIWYNRVDLNIARQLIFDDEGNILTDARYEQWHAFDNVAFPRHIEINRPRDEYGVVIDLTKIDINKGVSDEKFVLDQPEGTTLQVVGQAPPPAPPAQPNRRRPRTPRKQTD
jgi:outer membrane lipoprotein-sorting protein